MRLLRAAAVVVVGVAAVVFAPGVAAADTGTAQRACDPIWVWWIPFPCPSQSREDEQGDDDRWDDDDQWDELSPFYLY